jgi:hypothetical protein
MIIIDDHLKVPDWIYIADDLIKRLGKKRAVVLQLPYHENNLADDLLEEYNA